MYDPRHLAGDRPQHHARYGYIKKLAVKAIATPVEENRCGLDILINKAGVDLSDALFTFDYHD